MSTETATPQRSLKLMVKDDDVQKKFKEMLGDGGPAFLMSVLNCAQNNDKLAKAEPQSVLMAAAVAATLRMPIDPNLGQAYIIPYNEKIPNTSPAQYRCVAQFQIGYKGLIALCHRSSEYFRINADSVHEGEIVNIDRLTGDITYNWIQDNDIRDQTPVIGYVAYFKLTNGFQKEYFMTVKQIEAHAKRFSKSYKDGFGMWRDDKSGMSKKTVLKLLLDKFGPKSVDIAKAIRSDQAIIEDYDGNNIKYADNPENANLSKEENDALVIRNKCIRHIGEAKSLTSLKQCAADIVDDDVLDMYNKKIELLSKK